MLDSAKQRRYLARYWYFQQRLAKSLVDVCRHCGKPAIALLTDMNVPLGKMIGNALETREAIDILKGAGPFDSRELTLRLGGEMLLLGKAARSATEARSKLDTALTDGSAFERFLRMVRAQGGDTRCISDPRQLPHTPHRVAVLSPRNGWVSACDPKALAWVALEMGAGRLRADQAVDPAVGIELAVQYGEFVERRQPLAYLHLRQKRDAEKFEQRVRAAFRLTSQRPRARKLILQKLV